MGIQSQGPAMSRYRRQGRRRRAPISEINVTPFVDVMLVLLIIFMVTAPLLTAGVEVDLPKTNAPSISEPVEPLTLAVDADGNIFIQETAVDLEDLVAKLLAITERKKDTRIFIRGDRKINYGRVMHVMSAINRAGFANVALITEKPKGR